MFQDWFPPLDALPMDFYMINLIGSRRKKYDFINLRSQFLTLNAQVASETLLLPRSSNFASFVPWEQAFERHRLFTGLSTGPQLSANNTADTHF